MALQKEQGNEDFALDLPQNITIEQLYSDLENSLQG